MKAVSDVLRATKVTSVYSSSSALILRMGDGMRSTNFSCHSSLHLRARVSDYRTAREQMQCVKWIQQKINEHKTYHPILVAVEASLNYIENLLYFLGSKRLSKKMTQQ